MTSIPSPPRRVEPLRTSRLDAFAIAGGSLAAFGVIDAFVNYAYGSFSGGIDLFAPLRVNLLSWGFVVVDLISIAVGLAIAVRRPPTPLILIAGACCLLLAGYMAIDDMRTLRETQTGQVVVKSVATGDAPATPEPLGAAQAIYDLTSDLLFLTIWGFVVVSSTGWLTRRAPPPH